MTDNIDIISTPFHSTKHKKHTIHVCELFVGRVNFNWFWNMVTMTTTTTTKMSNDFPNEMEWMEMEIQINVKSQNIRQIKMGDNGKMNEWPTHTQKPKTV